jgi:4-amino-4-deoxy-L-arabinose transferase-like glycosyltransferase
VVAAIAAKRAIFAAVRELVRQNFRYFLLAILAGIALRLFFILRFPGVTTDSFVYGDIAKNWLQHGIYGLSGTEEISPTYIRLPGYPAFLAFIFAIFGMEHYRAVLATQMFVDIGTCFAIADMARRIISPRAAKAAFVLAAVCPFLANYAAAALTETLEIFFTALALDFAIVGLGGLAARGTDIIHADTAPDRRIMEHTGGTESTSTPGNDATGKTTTGKKLLGRKNTEKQATGKGTTSVVPTNLAFQTSRASPSSRGKTKTSVWLACGIAIAGAILLRPDGGLLLISIGVYLAFLILRRHPILPILRAGLIITVVSLAPLIPWTLRNLHTMRRFEPLAPRYANEEGEYVPMGFNRWIKTWIADYVSVEEIYWPVPGAAIDSAKLPNRAFDAPEQKKQTLQLINDYNQVLHIDPGLDARFAALATARVHAAPLRYYLWLPFTRIADMWLRPRTEMLPADSRWWEFNDDPKWSVVAVVFGAIGLAYVLAALFGLVRGRSIRHLGLLLAFVLLRSAFLGALENPEPRYMLECYATMIVTASALFAETKH